MGRLTTTLAILAALAPAARAADPPKPAAAPTPDAGQTSTSSRHHLNAVDAFVKQRAAAFEISKRPTDPFGLFQDPNVAPPPPKLSAKAPTKFMNIPPTPFADVVKAIEVSAVMPLQQRFLVGSRMIKLGDKFPIHYRDKSITVQVIKVGGKRIDFRNVQSGETAALPLDLLPPGMSRGARDSNGPPGLARDNPAAPIEVDVGVPSADITDKR